MKWPHGGATYEKDVTDTVQTAQHSDSQCTVHVYTQLPPRQPMRKLLNLFLIRYFRQLSRWLLTFVLFLHYSWLGSGSVLFLGETGRGAQGQYQGQLCVTVCTHVLYNGLYRCLVSSLGADPLTVLSSHVVESWKSTNIRNLWCSEMF